MVCPIAFAIVFGFVFFSIPFRVIQWNFEMPPIGRWIASVNLHSLFCTHFCLALSLLPVKRNTELEADKRQTILFFFLSHKSINLIEFGVWTRRQWDEIECHERPQLHRRHTGQTKMWFFADVGIKFQFFDAVTKITNEITCKPVDSGANVNYVENWKWKTENEVWSTHSGKNKVDIFISAVEESRCKLHLLRCSFGEHWMLRALHSGRKSSTSLLLFQSIRLNHSQNFYV